MDIKEKVLVVTGGALGIGRCLTREFARLGAKVAFLDRDEKAGVENLKHLEKIGGEHLFFHGDLAEEDVLRAFADGVTQKYQKIDFLVNNACLSRGGILKPCNYEDFNYVLRVGISAPYLLSMLFLPYFDSKGCIVNISSTRAGMSQPDTESYTAAKGGISALTHALAVSLAGSVRVNCVSPGWIDTGKYHDDGYVPSHSQADKAQHLSKRVGEPEDIVRAVLFLCNPENSFINGENITVDGGMTKRMIYSGDDGWEYGAKG